jgi:hypothetical protein
MLNLAFHIMLHRGDIHEERNTGLIYTVITAREKADGGGEVVKRIWHLQVAGCINYARDMIPICSSFGSRKNFCLLMSQNTYTYYQNFVIKL